MNRRDLLFACGGLAADGYAVKGGLATVPDAPGMGLAVNEARFAACVKPAFYLKQ